MAALVLAHHPDFRGQYEARNANRVERLFQIIKESATPMPIADSTRVGVGMPNVARALGLQAVESSIGTSPSPVQGDALVILRRLIDALANQKERESPVPLQVAPFSPFNDMPPPGSASVDSARDLLRRAGLL
jgi:hypothetical protein